MPQPSPARHAAPNAVDSAIFGRWIATPKTSARRCMNKPFIAMPPSTLSTAGLRPSAAMASSKSRV